MVRASRNASNLRRDQQWRDYAAEIVEQVHGPEVAAMLPGGGGAPAAGRMLARARALPAADGPPAPGAVLDGQPFARSWGSFLAALRSGDSGVRKVIANAMTERELAEGGALVPERLRQQVLAYMQTGIVQPRCTPVAMDALRVAIPALDNPSQASGAQALGGVTFSFTANGAVIPSSAPQFGRRVLEAWADKALIKGVPNELMADGTSFTADFLPRVLAMGLSWHIDDMAICQGTGAGQPEALVNAQAALAVTRSTSGKVLHADVVGLLKALHPASKSTATWLASEDVFDQLLELYELVGTAPTGQDISPPNVLKCKNGRWELFGLEIIPNDHQPAVGTPGDLMLADLGLLLLGDLGAMTVEVAKGGAGFVTDTSDIRIRYRWDSRFWLPGTVTLANGKVTSPLVTLN